MKPYYERNGIVIYHGDCREILPSLKADVVVTDPPYLVRAGHGGGVFGERDHLVRTGGFTDGGVDYSFLDGRANWMCFCSRKQIPELVARAVLMERWNLLTWCKPNPVPTCSNKYLPDVEFVVHGFGSGQLFGTMADKSCYMVSPSSKESSHPNEKPLRVMRKLIRSGSDESGSILDPFMGSGTTLVAAKLEGRKAIGIEISEKYCEIAAKRLAQEVFEFRE